MEIKLPGTEDREQQYFDNLLARVRDIRASERTPRQKVADIISLASDYDKEDAIPLLSLLNSRMTALGTNGDLRFANCMIMSVERWAECHHPLTMKSIEEQQRYWLKELEGFKGGSMILKLEDMDRFIDTFCSRDTRYRRAYDILHELDKRVLESLEAGEFQAWIDIDYKDGGSAFFEFSHFEVDLREPDSQYRTLYVVYRYDTTAS